MCGGRDARRGVGRGVSGEMQFFSAGPGRPTPPKIPSRFIMCGDRDARANYSCVADRVRRFARDPAHLQAVLEQVKGFSVCVCVCVCKRGCRCAVSWLYTDVLIYVFIGAILIKLYSVCSVRTCFQYLCLFCKQIIMKRQTKWRVHISYLFAKTIF